MKKVAPLAYNPSASGTLVYWVNSMATLRFSPQIGLQEVCDAFNGRFPESLTRPKLLLAVSEYVMIISITTGKRKVDETTSRTFFFRFLKSAG